MKLVVLAVLSGLLAQAVAAPAPAAVTHLVHERRDIDGSKWIRSDAKLRRDAILPMSIGLSQQNLHNGHDYLMDVSDPKSPNFGKHWSMDKVHHTLQHAAAAK